MKNQNLYYVLGGVAVVGLVYFLIKKKKQDVVVNLNPPMEIEEETPVATTTSVNSAVSILDKIKEIIAEVKKKNVATPPTTTS